MMGKEAATTSPPSGWSIWFTWVAATCIGLIPSCALPVVVASDSREDGHSLLAVSVLFAIPVLVGATQHLALRYILPAERHWLRNTLLATLIVGAIPLILGLTHDRIRIRDDMAEAFLPVFLLFLLVAGLLVLIPIGQLLILERYSRRAPWWLLASPLGWIAGLLVAGEIMFPKEGILEAYHYYVELPADKWTYVPGLTRTVAADLAIGVLVGGVTGAALVHILTAESRIRLLLIAIAGTTAVILAIPIGYWVVGPAMTSVGRAKLAETALAAGPVYVPAGEFLMGSAEGEAFAYSDEVPEHRVYLDAFEIDRVEVTNAMYARCVEAGACKAPAKNGAGNRSRYYDNPAYKHYPVVYVSWADAQAYCQWIGGRLPTEAEWEKAARGTDGREYPWGNDAPAEVRCNAGGVDDGSPTPVGAYPAGASPYGALDMAGNVAEWVADWYGEEYYGGSPARNPLGPASGQDRMLRGGSWLHSIREVRLANRATILPDHSTDDIGFRCVRNP